MVIGLFLLEAVLLGIFSGLVGGLAGAGLNYMFSIDGIDFSSQLNSLGEISIPAKMYTMFSFSQVIFSILFGVLVALLASIMPAFHSVTIAPADAVRRN